MVVRVVCHRRRVGRGGPRRERRVALLGDRTGLTSGLSKAMTRRSFVAVHDRGRVLADVAVMVADGGEAIPDIEVLRQQSQVLGPVASAPTVRRTLDEVTSGRLKKIAAARARVRRQGPPAAR